MKKNSIFILTVFFFFASQMMAKTMPHCDMQKTAKNSVEKEAEKISCHGPKAQKIPNSNSKPESSAKIKCDCSVEEISSLKIFFSKPESKKIDNTKKFVSFLHDKILIEVSNFDIKHKASTFPEFEKTPKYISLCSYLY